MRWVRDKSKVAIASTLVISVLLAVLGVFVMTDVGQLLAIDKAIVVGYFKSHMVFMASSVLLFAVAVYLNRSHKLLRSWLMAGAGVFLVVCFVSTKYAAPYMLFRSQQHNSVYKTIAQAEDYLEPDDVVYVVARNGVVRGFPQKYIWQPHIFGGDYGGESIILTYCVLTNLPVAYSNDLDGQPMNLKVLAQTNNNLLLWDTTSGEIIQQITNTCEFSKRELEPLPVIQTNWKSFKELFPEGYILYNQFDTPVERALEFFAPLQDAHSGDKWMFNTVNTDDQRLGSKEQIIGVKDSGEAVAYTRDFLREAKVINTRVGKKLFAIAHIPEHDMFVAFDRMKDGLTIEVTEVDVFGNTKAHGQLERVFIYNGVLWAVWAHYHPETRLMK